MWWILHGHEFQLLVLVFQINVINVAIFKTKGDRQAQEAGRLSPERNRKRAQNRSRVIAPVLTRVFAISARGAAQSYGGQRLRGRIVSTHYCMG